MVQFGHRYTVHIYATLTINDLKSSVENKVQRQVNLRMNLYQYAKFGGIFGRKNFQSIKSITSNVVFSCIELKNVWNSSKSTKTDASLGVGDPALSWA